MSYQRYVFRNLWRPHYTTFWLLFTSIFNDCFMLFQTDARGHHIEFTPGSLTKEWILTKQGDTYISRDKLTPTNDRSPICICLLNCFSAFSKGIYCIYLFYTESEILILFPPDVGDRFPIVIFSIKESWLIFEGIVL